MSKQLRKIVSKVANLSSGESNMSMIDQGASSRYLRKVDSSNIL